MVGIVSKLQNLPVSGRLHLHYLTSDGTYKTVQYAKFAAYIILIFSVSSTVTTIFLNQDSEEIVSLPVMYVWYERKLGTTCLDYWNVVYTGVNWASLSCLQTQHRLKPLNDLPASYNWSSQKLPNFGTHLSIHFFLLFGF